MSSFILKLFTVIGNNLVDIGLVTEKIHSKLPIIVFQINSISF